MNSIRKSIRRSLIVASVAALALTSGAVMAPAPSADEGRIWVSILPNGTVELVGIGISAFLPTEELFIAAQGKVVRIEMRDDESPSGQGRALLADGNTLASRWCSFADFRGSATVTCDYEGPLGPQYLGIPQVRVDFGTLTGATTVAMAEGRNVPLAFNGGSGPDEVYGAAGDDWIRGNGGDDVLFGGPGDDYIDGGPGNDYITGEEGRDDMRGGPGVDSIDAADGIADIRVDCGGPPGPRFDYDEGLDKLTNCGDNPTPIPPAPIEPVDPPPPGEGNGTVDGAPIDVEVTPQGDDTTSTSITSSQGNISLETGLWFGTPGNPPVPSFPPFTDFFPLTMFPLFPGSLLELSIWSTPQVGGASVGVQTRTALRAAPISSRAIKVNAQGVGEGNVAVPAGQEPGNFTLQVNAVTASGSAVTLNVGVALTHATPEPDPGPTETITIGKPTRGKAKKAATIIVTGTTTGLAGKSITPRYRVKGVKKWTLGTPVTVRANGSFTWRHSERREITIMMVSGAIRSKSVKVGALRK